MPYGKGTYGSKRGRPPKRAGAKPAAKGSGAKLRKRAEEMKKRGIRGMMGKRGR